mmetsp:Transcript_60063/g.178825  ORF Transcript_60063/g.178825 Transcript_60063/m.178825 type:complete len:352 (+) Transcript_60063:2-1057(+)
MPVLSRAHARPSRPPGAGPCSVLPGDETWSAALTQITPKLVHLEGLLELLGLVGLPLIKVHQALKVAVTELVESRGLDFLLHLAGEVRVVLRDGLLPVHGRQVGVRNAGVAGWLDLHRSTGALGREPQEGPHVVAGVEVVGCAEDAQESGVVPPVAGGFDLVGAHDALQAVLLAERLRDVGSKHVDPLALAVGRAVSGAAAGVTPEDVDEHPCVVHLLIGGSRTEGLRIVLWGDLQVAIDSLDVRKGRQRAHGDRIGGVVRLSGHPDARIGPRQACMQHQNLVLHKVAEGQVPEGLREEVKEASIILGDALPAEAVEDVGLQHLVVPAVHANKAGVLQLEGKQHHDHLYGP